MALKISLILMSPDSQPIIHSLYRQLNIFRRFQLDYHQTAALCDAQQIDYAAIPAAKVGTCEYKCLVSKCASSLPGSFRMSFPTNAPAPRDKVRDLFFLFPVCDAIPGFVSAA